MALGEQFYQELLDALPTAHAKMICVGHFRKWAGTTIYLPAEKENGRRVEVARHMLDNGMSTADAAIKIHERYGVTLRQAQRDVKAACQMSS